MATHQNIRMSPPETKHTKNPKNIKPKREKPTYTMFQRKKFQILCIETLLDRMKHHPEIILLISANDQNNLLSVEPISFFRDEHKR